MFDPAYVENLRKELKHQQKRLEELSDPTLRFFSGHDNEPMRDVTEELIAEKADTVEMYTKLLDAVEKKLSDGS